ESDTISEKIFTILWADSICDALPSVKPYAETYVELDHEGWPSPLSAARARIPAFYSDRGQKMY
ncbi:MAG: hypothetical protein ACP5OM_03785, partial [Methanothrix sp.]